jgi:hypothetical protein
MAGFNTRRRSGRFRSRHCEERSDEAIQAGASEELDCFAALAMTLMERHYPLSSSPAKAGDPVRCGLSDQSLMSLEYWITRLRG